MLKLHFMVATLFLTGQVLAADQAIRNKRHVGPEHQVSSGYRMMEQGQHSSYKRTDAHAEKKEVLKWQE